MVARKRILFVFAHNSVSSQMAEGYMKARYGERYKAFCAGTEITWLDPLAVTVMNEIGINLSHCRLKLVDDFFGVDIDTVVTVSGQARDACPFIPGTKNVIHTEFPDPSSIAGSDDEILAGFRDMRDSITHWIDAHFGNEKLLGK
ncbi:MAG: arsenate reductase ArsC [Methanoregulaceae archaeon]